MVLSLYKKILKNLFDEFISKLIVIRKQNTLGHISYTWLL